MDGLIRDIRNINIKKDSGDDYLLMNSKYKPVLIESKNFHDIDALTVKNMKKNLLFVDGGNNILFEGASFCIGIIRVGAILYSKNARKSRKSKEFYILVNMIEGEYSVSTYPKTSFDGLVFDPEDESLRDGIEKCSPSRIISVIRRFAEIEYAYEQYTDITDKDNHKGNYKGNDKFNIDYILMDGTLEARYPSEARYIERLMSTGKACALSKTCSLVTENGFGIVHKLLSMAQRDIVYEEGGADNRNYAHDAHDAHRDMWYYYPIVKSNNPLHKSEIYFVKLHMKSEHTFRLEIQHGFIGKPEEFICSIAANSADPIFLGYPYGLIDVDQYARISDDESKLARTKFSVKMGKEWNLFSKSLTSNNAHAILDKIRF
ncbi:MAG: DNA double-strand break repair nuclease NurA [Candidatus Woesearchaeota archaeon]